MSTLKTAVNSFIDETAKTNSERSNENLRSRISLVKFAGKKKATTWEMILPRRTGMTTIILRL